MAKVGCCTKRVDLFYQRTARASSSAGSKLLASGVNIGIKVNYITKLAQQLEHTMRVPRYAMETFILGTDL